MGLKVDFIKNISVCKTIVGETHSEMDYMSVSFF